jgi:hypothetical protein
MLQGQIVLTNLLVNMIVSYFGFGIGSGLRKLAELKRE